MLSGWWSLSWEELSRIVDELRLSDREKDERIEELAHENTLLTVDCQRLKEKLEKVRKGLLMLEVE